MIDIVQWRANIGRYHSGRYYRGSSGNGCREVVSSLCYSVSGTVLVIVALLMMCCGDIESNPGPGIEIMAAPILILHCIELTVINATLLLSQCGFDKWDELLHYLGLPLEHVQQMSYFDKMGPVTQWITDQQPSWEVLVSAVEKCGAIDTANNMRRELGITAPAGMLEEGNRAMTNILLISDSISLLI